MELLQLKYFCDSAKRENFSATAKKFGVPPSDVSQSVRRLEKELDVALFERQANKITLNEKGRCFFEFVSQALNLIDDAKNLVTSDINEGRIKICINSNRRIVMQTIEKFKLVYPDVEIKTTHFSDPASEDFDIIVSGELTEYHGYSRRKLLSEEMLLAMRSDSEFAVDSIDVNKLKNASFITMTEKSSLLGLTKKICNDLGFEPRITLQSDDPFYVRKCVELGLGLAFVPSFSWQGQFSSDITLREIAGYTRDSYIYIKEERYVTHEARNFYDMLIAECN